MLTINYNGKTYQQTKGDWVMHRSIQNWIEEGFMEELPQNTEEKPIPAHLLKRMEEEVELTSEKNKILQKMTKDPSILEKLREFLEKNQKECFDTAKLFKGDWQEHHHNGAGAMCSATLDLLNSLETKEEPEETGWKEWEKHTFTPGQMIEVSDDNKIWWIREFINYSPGLVGDESKYQTKIYDDREKTTTYQGWKYARPLQETLPEVPSLPEWEKIRDEISDYINPYPQSCYYQLNLEKLCKYLNESSLKELLNKK